MTTMTHFFGRWYLILLVYPGVMATVDTEQQEKDCEFGGNNVEHYKEQFRQKNERFGLKFDNFCITKDLETSECCINESTGGVISDFIVYEISSDSWGLPRITSPSGTDAKHTKWGIRAASETSDPNVILSRNRTCLKFDWKRVMKNLTFGKVELTVQYPNNESQTFNYISDIHDTPYSVWVPPPRIDIRTSNDSLTVSLEDKEFQYNYWQLCICVKDGANRKCNLDPPSLYSSSSEWTRSLSHYKNNELQVCVGFAYSSFTGTFGPDRICKNVTLNRTTASSGSWTSSQDVGGNREKLIFILLLPFSVVPFFIYFVYKRESCKSRWVSRLKLCYTKPQTVQVSIPEEESSCDEMNQRPVQNENIYEDITSDSQYYSSSDHYTDIDGPQVEERNGASSDLPSNYNSNTGDSQVSISASNSQTDSGISSGLSNARNCGFMYQEVPQTELSHKTQPLESYQCTDHSEQDYSYNETSLHERQSSSEPEICQDDESSHLESKCQDDSVDDIYSSTK